MTRKLAGARLYRRGNRWWADLRSFADVGGKELTLGTTDKAVATRLLAEKVQALENARRGRAFGILPTMGLATAVARHLEAKARGTTTDSWIATAEVFLGRGVAFFGAERDLASIGVADANGWVAQLRTYRQVRKPGKPGRPLSDGTIRHHLNALSNLYKRAASEGWVPPGFNPVAAMMEKPAGARKEAHYLEVPDAALFLEAARTLPTTGRDHFDRRLAYPLVAAFLLTGGREAEVLGLEVEDVSFDKQTVTIRPNSSRRLKTLTSARVVPLWPQLGTILQAYVLDRPPGRLLFPSYLTGSEAMITDTRKLLDRVAVRAGLKKGEIRSKMFRHTYCAARLQTLDGGAPVSPFTVSRELGHGSREMVEKIYGHLGTIRHRSEEVEYRVEQHAERLGDRLALLTV